MLSFVRKDVGGIGCGDSVGSVYVDCIDYEVKRREVGEGDIVELGDVLYTIVYDMFWRGVGDMGCVGVGVLDVGVFGCVGMFGYVGGVRCPNLA